MHQRIPIGLLGALVLIAGCSSHAPHAELPIPDPYDFTSEGTFPRAPTVTATPTSAFRAAPDIRFAEPDATAVRDSVGNSRFGAQRMHTYRQGWSVQIFAGRSREQANQIQAQLQHAVSEAVYVDYVEPYYKVRVGDCEEREECDTLQQRLRDLGSASAWVVPRTIQGAVEP